MLCLPRVVPATLTVAAALALAACTPPTGPTTAPPTASTPPSVASTPAPAATDAPSRVELEDALGRTTTIALTDGVVGLTDGTLGAGSTTVTATFASAGATLTVPAPEGASWEVPRDGSAALLDDAVPEVGGMTPPVARDATGATLRAEVEAERGPVVVSLLARSATALPVTVTFDVATSALEKAVWADRREGGRSLPTFPTAVGRSGSQAALVAVRAALVAAEPEAATSVMDKQLRCHALGAPTKESWNLEPWRPDVDYMDYLLARCNPS